MDQPGPSTSKESSAKRSRSNSENDQPEIAQNVVAVVADDIAAQRRVQTGDIFKMDIDCFEESFDYLPFVDLISVGQTCKYLNNMAGHCYLQYYPSDEFNLQSDAAKYFTVYITKLKIESEDEFNDFVRAQTKFRRLKQICLTGIKLTKSKIKMIESTLGKLECLCIEWFDIEIGSLEMLILSCPKIKRLSMSRMVWNWPAVKCPSLECLEVDFGDQHKRLIENVQLNRKIQNPEMIQDEFKNLIESIKKNSNQWSANSNQWSANSNQWSANSNQLPVINQSSIERIIASFNSKYKSLMQFIQLNPNIQKLVLKGEIMELKKQMEAMKTTTVSLHVLAIKLVTSPQNLEPLRDLLIELQEGGHFKRLEICESFINTAGQINTDMVNELTPLNEILFKLATFTIIEKTDLSNVSNIHELSIESYVSVDFEYSSLVATILTNLQRLRFKHVRIGHILAFINQAERLKEIKVDKLYRNSPTDTYELDNIIDLRALNKAREQMAQGQYWRDWNVTIYASEDVYLATKWAMNGNEIGLIRMKRGE